METRKWERVPEIQSINRPSPLPESTARKERSSASSGKVRAQPRAFRRIDPPVRRALSDEFWATGLGPPELRRVGEADPIEFHLIDRRLADGAARLKARYRISLADAFAAARAKERKAPLVTGDPEFRLLEKEIKVHWLRSLGG